MSESNYTLVYGILQLLRYQNNKPAVGTGILVYSTQARNIFGSHPPPSLIKYQTQHQINLFGDYPISSDKVPSAIFAGVFALITLLHLTIFIINCSRRHRFWLSLGWVAYGMMRSIGFGMRIQWASDLTQVPLGIADGVLLILPTILLVSLNLILAQRIFTWRHPVGGSRRLFWGFMITLYVFVILIIGMTIACAAIPYVHLLSEKSYKLYQKGVQASAVLILLYSLTAISLLGMAYFFKPTRKDENLYTYQPWWIESFLPFYFVKKGAVREAEESFMRRTHNHRHAIRVIAATHHHYKSVQGLNNERGDLVHNFSLCMILVTTLFIFIGAICRTITVFQGRYQIDSGPLCKPVAMYICWGLMETTINALYIVGRADLRFYRPDRLPRSVRSIITAEQSIEQSLASTDDVRPYTSEEDYTAAEDDDSSDGFDLTRKEKRQDFVDASRTPDFRKRSIDEDEFHF